MYIIVTKLVKMRCYFGYKIGILRDDGLKFSPAIQCKPTNDITMK